MFGFMQARAHAHADGLTLALPLTPTLIPPLIPPLTLPLPLTLTPTPKQTSFFFGYMLMAAYAAFIMLGTIGHSNSSHSSSVTRHEPTLSP